MIKLKDLNIPSSIIYNLHRAGVDTVYDCINIDPLKIRGIGIKSAIQLAQKLQELGAINDIWEKYLPENQSN